MKPIEEILKERFHLIISEEAKEELIDIIRDCTRDGIKEDRAELKATIIKIIDNAPYPYLP